MKYRTTLKAINANYNNVICLPYCAAQTMLSVISPVAYAAGRDGWSCDVYEVAGVAICTGYRPTGNIRPAYDTVQEFERRAQSIGREFWSWDERKPRLLELLRDFVETVANEA